MPKLRILAGFLLAYCIASAQQPAPAAQTQFIEGQHYKLVSPPQPTNNADKIEVIEVFSYACPHCATFQPAISGWHDNMPENAEFSRIAAVFSPSWEPYARGYYTAEALGILEASHQGLFDKLHKERKRFRSMDDIAEFYTAYGVTKEQFLQASKSFSVETKIRRGVAMARRYGVEGTPSVIVNGKFRTSVSMAGSPGALITLLNQLISSETALAATVEPAAPVAEAAQDAG